MDDQEARLAEKNNEALAELVHFVETTYIAQLNPMLSQDQNITRFLAPLLCQLWQGVIEHASDASHPHHRFSMVNNETYLSNHPKIRAICQEFTKSTKVWCTHETNVHDILHPLLFDFVTEIDMEIRAGDALPYAVSRPKIGHSSASKSMQDDGSHEEQLHVYEMAPSTPPSIMKFEDIAVSGRVIFEGWLKKKGQHIHLWRDRYFILCAAQHHDHDDDDDENSPEHYAGPYVLFYYRQKGDVDIRDFYVIGPDCSVDWQHKRPLANSTQMPSHSSSSKAKFYLTHCTRQIVHQANMLAKERPPVMMSPTESSSLALEPIQRASSLDDISFLSPSTRGIHHHHAPGDVLHKKEKTRRKKRAATAAAIGTAAFLTGGIAGVVMATAAASAYRLGKHKRKHLDTIALATSSEAQARVWKAQLDRCICLATKEFERLCLMEEQVKLGQEVQVDDLSSSSHHPRGNGASSAIARRRSSMEILRSSYLQSTSGSAHSPLKSSTKKSTTTTAVPRFAAQSFRSNMNWLATSSWRMYGDPRESGLIIWEEKENTVGHPTKAPTPSFKTSMVIHATPQAVFELLMHLRGPYYAKNTVIASARTIESVDTHSDYIHLRLHAMEMMTIGGFCPLLSCARDFVLMRCWRVEENGSFVIFFHSTTHPECPVALSSSVVRGQLVGGFIIAPRVETDGVMIHECQLTQFCQVDPMGFLGSSLGHRLSIKHAFGATFLEQMIHVESILEHQQYTCPAGKLKSVQRRICGKTDHASRPRLTYLTFEQQQALVETAHRFSNHEVKWTECPVGTFHMRKCKDESDQVLFQLILVEYIYTRLSLKHLASRPGHFVELMRSQKFTTPSPYYFLVIQCSLPTRRTSMIHNLIFHFIPTQDIKDDSLWSQYIHDRKNINAEAQHPDRIQMKVLPRVIQGSWIAQMVIGTNAVLVSPAQINHEDHYFELNCELTDEISGLLELLANETHDLVLAFVFYLETTTQQQRSILGTVQLDGVQFLKP